MIPRGAMAPALALAAALTLLSAQTTLAGVEICPTGDPALHFALSQNLANDAALLRQRGIDAPAIEAPPDQIAALLADAFKLTPQREVLLVYTQTDSGLCALVFDGSTVTSTASRPGQGAGDLTAARLALSAALHVDARQVQRAGHLRSAAALEGADDPAEAPSEDPTAAAARLAGLLMLPDLAPGLGGADEILILPANDIGTVPFAFLPLGHGMVIDLAPVTIAPSAAALVRQPDELSPALAGQLTTGPIAFTPVWSGALVVGDPEATDDPDWSFPPLPGARAEAQAIAARFGTDPVLGAKATPDAILAALSQPADLVYFAAHGVSSDDFPLTLSFIALTGGRLTAGEVQGLRLPNRPLVVLSACQTGLGQSHAGGTIGLARAFVLAGASAVVSTLWNVNDAATERLMGDFAGNLTAMRPAEALRAAMLAGRDHDPDDPALWAGVMLFGGLSTLSE
ncbi:MAG: CHAT domain-containing protein [Rhodobacterales bacterium]|nr:CHAT domain-containing protein [Rhodobacterales bacterium]